MLKISVDGYQKQTTRDYFRVLKLLELQAEWDQQDINEAYDRISELEKEKIGQMDIIRKVGRENDRLRKELKA